MLTVRHLLAQPVHGLGDPPTFQGFEAEDADHRLCLGCGAVSTSGFGRSGFQRNFEATRLPRGDAVCETESNSALHCTQFLTDSLLPEPGFTEVRPRNAACGTRQSGRTSLRSLGAGLLERKVKIGGLPFRPSGKFTGLAGNWRMEYSSCASRARVSPSEANQSADR